jgi:hypothetical protein
MGIVDVLAYFGNVQVLNSSNQCEHFRSQKKSKTRKKKVIQFPFSLDVRLVACYREAFCHADKEDCGFISLGLFNRCFARQTFFKFL